jgi:putative endonuclease
MHICPGPVKTGPGRFLPGDGHERSMTYWTYILQSATRGRYYCGFSDNVARRVTQHNDPGYRGSKTTKRFEGPWELVWQRESGTRAEAMALEKRIKKRGIGRFLDDMKLRNGESLSW